MFQTKQTVECQDFGASQSQVREVSVSLRELMFQSILFPVIFVIDFALFSFLDKHFIFPTYEASFYWSGFAAILAVPSFVVFCRNFLNLPFNILFIILFHLILLFNEIVCVQTDNCKHKNYLDCFTKSPRYVKKGNAFKKEMGHDTCCHQHKDSASYISCYVEEHDRGMN